MNLRKYFLLALFVLVSVANSYGVAAFADDYVLIANTKTPVVTLSKQEVKDIFMGDRTVWSDNQRVRPVRLDDNSLVTKEFIESVVGISVTDFLQHWHRRLFSGRAIPPKRFEHSEDAAKFVEENEGTIAFVDKGTFKPSTKVKVVELK